jgi:hypothetical protein
LGTSSITEQKWASAWLITVRICGPRTVLMVAAEDGGRRHGAQISIRRRQDADIPALAASGGFKDMRKFWFRLP